MNPCKNTIGWADFTWNPITGCKRGCLWCYAKRLHDMRYKAKQAGKHLPECYSKPFEEITFYPERLNDSGLKAKKPRTIFVGSVSDPEYWDKNDFYAVLTRIYACEQHTFMFLTKNPDSYNGMKWPTNCMQGLTITCKQNKQDQIDLILKMFKVGVRRFLSIEPLLGPFLPNKISFDRYERVIVGAMTGPDAVPPKREWIQSIKDKCPKEKIYWKKNIQKYL